MGVRVVCTGSGRGIAAPRVTRAHLSASPSPTAGVLPVAGHEPYAVHVGDRARISTVLSRRLDKHRKDAK